MYEHYNNRQMDARMRESFLRELMILQSPSILSPTTNRQVDITLLADTSSTGRTVSGLFVACDTNLTHILLNDLKTPIGIQPNALLRLNDVITISYC